MDKTVIEATFPLTFRKEEAAELGKQLKNRSSVVLVGMKRVGINNFLRFFLYHEKIVKTYISPTQKHLFIPVDLNDLVEKEIFPFWRLTFKRIIDALEDSNYPVSIKTYAEELFSSSIQSQDLFLTIDGVRKTLQKIVENGIFPNIFFIRFDRIKDAVTPEFFANLQGLQDATHGKLAYVFTSFRRLDILAPEVFTRASLSTFAQEMYMKPAKKEDMEIIYKTYKDEYKLTISPAIEQSIFDLADGYVQYFQLVLIFLHEGKKEAKTKAELFDLLLKDERISLQSEELWESLSEKEKEIIVKISKGQAISDEERKLGRYIWDSGFLYESQNNIRALFSPLFDYYIQQKDKKPLSENGSIEFSRKEHALFSFLKDHISEICEREKIVEAVWPEVEELGVSDWAIDRLVARVRSKLKLQKSQYEIQTIKTPGYKLVPS